MSQQIDEKKEEVRIEQWVVVITAAGQYLGRVIDDGMPIEFDLSDPAMSRNDQLAELLEEDALKEGIELNPAFELSTPVVKGADGRNQRGALTLPLGVTKKPVSLFVRPVAAYACGLMEAEDQEVYRSVIERSLAMLEKMQAGETGAPAPARGNLIVPGV